MRPILALYIGGMGSREQNFYNSLVERYGFEEAAAGSRTCTWKASATRPAAALPEELIDLVSLCGPRDVVADRLGRVPRRGRRHAAGLADGVRPPGRLDQLRAIAELSG